MRFVEILARVSRGYPLCVYDVTASWEEYICCHVTMYIHTTADVIRNPLHHHKIDCAPPNNIIFNKWCTDLLVGNYRRVTYLCCVSWYTNHNTDNEGKLSHIPKKTAHPQTTSIYEFSSHYVTTQLGTSCWLRLRYATLRSAEVVVLLIPRKKPAHPLTTILYCVIYCVR